MFLYLIFVQRGTDAYTIVQTERLACNPDASDLRGVKLSCFARSELTSLPSSGIFTSIPSSAGVTGFCDSSCDCWAVTANLATG